MSQASSPRRDNTTNIISARVDKRYVTVKVESGKESDNISRVTYQVSISGVLNHDWRLASELVEATLRNLVVQENPQPQVSLSQTRELYVVAENQAAIRLAFFISIIVPCAPSSQSAT